MSRDLAAEIHGFLADQPEGSDVESIARGIKAQTQAVRETLRSDERFSGPWKHGHGARVTHVWKARAVKADGQGRARKTQGAQIVELLSDGNWHSTAAILRHVPCIVHSRVAEINKRGQYRIEHRGSGGGAENHEYRLRPLEETGARLPSSPGSVSSSGAAVVPPWGTDGPAPLVQLSLLAAA